MIHDSISKLLTYQKNQADPTKPFNDLYDREDFAECARVLIERRLKEGKTLPMIRAAAMWALYRGPSACVFTHPFHVRNNRLNNATVWVAQEMIIAASTARHQDGARNKEDILVMRNKEGGRNEDGAREKHGE